LSYIINARLNKNFFDFVNEFRIKEAAAMLRNPEYKDYNIMRIAFEVGFKSKSTFNKAFKKHTRFTPSAYRKKHSR
jgi:AraC-like DNA-binding protein